VDDGDVNDDDDDDDDDGMEQVIYRKTADIVYRLNTADEYVFSFRNSAITEPSGN